MDIKNFKAGEIIVKEGNPGSEFYILIFGKVAVYKKQLKVAEIFEHGEIFGELAILLDNKRTASIVAEEDTQAYIVNTTFNELIKQSSLVKTIIVNMAERLERVTENLRIITETE